ncbi:MAG: substrate-binding domain-containing protein [Cyanobacteria bacterium]|nr:substrate-binding domain-containing protein [Cyanobacteriota bacterium]
MTKKLFLVIIGAVLSITLILASCTTQSVATTTTAAQTTQAAATTTAAQTTQAAATTAAETTTAKKLPVIGFSNASVSNTWRVAMWDMLRAQLDKDKADGKIKDYYYVDGEDNDAKQAAGTEDMLNKGIDLLLIAPATESSLDSVIEKAYDSGIPVIVFDRRCTTDKYTTFVVTDDVKNGEMAAQRMVELLTEANGAPKGDIVVIQGWVGSGPQIDRQKGIDNVLSKYPDIKQIAKPDSKFQRSEGKKAMADVLTRFKHIDGIISHSGEGLCGALEAVDEAGRTDCKLITCIDGYNGVLKLIKSGRVDSTYLFPARLGLEAYLVGMKVLAGEKVDKVTYLPNIKVDKSNVDQYVNMNGDDGLWTY